MPFIILHDNKSTREGYASYGFDKILTKSAVSATAHSETDGGEYEQ